jgi:hypothetical protein
MNETLTASLNNYVRLNYGYSCANNGKYIAISTVAIDAFETASGVVDVLQYNTSTNSYENKFLLKKLVNPTEYSLLLNTESDTTGSNGILSGSMFLTTEASSSYDLTSSNSPLMFEVDSIFNLIDEYYDEFGTSLALKDELLTVGCPNFYVQFVNGDEFNSGSITGSVDIFDLSTYVPRQPYYPTASLSQKSDTTFGESVSMCGDSTGSLYLAIGSSAVSSSKGAVYIYKRNGTDNTSWSYLQTLTNNISGECFGGKVKFDQSGTRTLVVGNSNTSSNSGKVYVYDFSGSSWIYSDTLIPNSISQSLDYLGGVSPVIQANSCSGYGNSVSIDGNNLIVGAPTDTVYLEYSGSSTIRHRGAIYFYRRCETPGCQWGYLQKTWGNIDTLINNKLGFDVDIYGNTAVATVPRYYTNFTTAFIENTLQKKLDCSQYNDYYDTLGQTLILNYDYTGSWNIVYTQQKMKDFGYPYLNYGYRVALYDETFVVGAPCFITDYLTLTNTFNSTIQGYAFVYNINNLVSNMPVGNIFYRDGKIILSNSGSLLSNLLKDKYDDRHSKYDITYKSQLTLHEKQIVCTIQPGEFNYSTNPSSFISNSFFSFKDLDFMFKYVNSTIYGAGYYDWWNNLQFTEVEESLFEMYTETYDYQNTTILPYIATLSSSCQNWDVDGNNKVNLNDMTIIWKYFTKTLNQTDIFKYIEPKSTRKLLTEILNYIEQNVVIKTYGKINPLFMEFDYSSSMDNTGSYLAPYITTVGLYSGADLVGIGKLANPVKNSGEYTLNLLVKLDF